MFDSVLIANRGEIACRVVRTCHQMGVRAITVHSEADTHAMHVMESDASVLLGPTPPAQSYLNGDRILDAARRCGAEAVHPGYGFLSESADFAQQVLDAGLAWIGPPPDAIECMGDKIRARNTMAAAGVPVAAGVSTPMTDVDEAVVHAAHLGYPLMVKAAAGGGGIGMGVAHDEAELRGAFATAAARATRFFGSRSILLERYIPRARHVEIQILGLGDGRIVTVGERDCSVQRRHQKVAEESPSPGLSPTLRLRMIDAAERAGRAVGYRGAGTVECLVDVEAQDFVFLEMNTRLQVEHPVTEAVFGMDLVEQQLRVAAGEPPTYDPGLTPQGHALEMRIYAEDPVRFLPSPGAIRRWEEPTGPDVRVDAGYREGDVVSPHYDPLLAKLVVWGRDRHETLSRARMAVKNFIIEGPKVNLSFLQELLIDEEFVSGRYDTGLVARMRTPSGASATKSGPPAGRTNN